METKFQTSFIPKTTIVPTIDSGHRKGPTSFFLVFSFFLFLISILLGGLSFAYLKYLADQKVSISSDLEKNIKAFEPDTIRRYARLDSKIDTAKSLLEKHIALSYFLEFLGNETLKSVRFSEMKYSLSSDGKEASLGFSGQATGYNAVAFQSAVFGKNPNLKNVLFSDLNLDKSGNVVFVLSLNIDSSFVYYKKSVNEKAAENKNVSLESNIDIN